MPLIFLVFRVKYMDPLDALRADLDAYIRGQRYLFFFFFLDNFVATPLRLFLKEKGNRLSPSGFPRGPAYRLQCHRDSGWQARPAEAIMITRIT